jgi:catalase
MAAISSSSRPEARYGVAALLAPAPLAKLGLVGAIVLGVAALFAWAGDWFSPGALTQTRMVDTFERANGQHPGFRRNHAKGLCLAGSFTSSGAAQRLSKAEVFKLGDVPVLGRFALAGGMPMMADSPAAVRSMALQFALADGELWRTGMNAIPVFPLKDPGAFYEQLLAGTPDARTGKPDPEKMRAFVTAHPETAKALSLIRAKPFSSGFANAQYNGLNTFLFTSANGKATPVRWSMVPADTFEAEPTAAPADKNYLFDELAARLQKSPAEWHLMVTIGQPGDSIEDATVPWPDGREQVDAGTLHVTSLVSEAEGNCRDINFDPLVLPAGILPSGDPLLSARSAAYSTSFTRREGEPKTPSAVQIPGGK